MSPFRISLKSINQSTLFCEALNHMISQSAFTITRETDSSLQSCQSIPPKVRKCHEEEGVQTSELLEGLLSKQNTRVAGAKATELHVPHFNL